MLQKIVFLEFCPRISCKPTISVKNTQQVSFRIVFLLDTVKHLELLCLKHYDGGGGMG